MNINQSPQRQQIHNRFLETKHRIFANNRLDFQRQLENQMARIQYLGTEGSIKGTMNQKVYAILYGSMTHNRHGQQQLQCQTETSQEIMKKVCLQDQRKASYERQVSGNESNANKDVKTLPSLQNRSSKRMQQFIEKQNKSKRSTSQNAKVADLSPSYSANKLNMTTRDLAVMNPLEINQNSAENLAEQQNQICNNQVCSLQDESGFTSAQNKLSGKRSTLNNPKQPLKTSYFNVSSYFNWKKSSQSPPPPLRQNQLKNQQLTLQSQITFEKDITPVDVSLPEKRHSYACFSQERESSITRTKANNLSKITKFPEDIEKYIKGNESTSNTSHTESTRPFSRTFQKASQVSANELTSLPIKTEILSRNKILHKEDANLMSSLFGKKKMSNVLRNSQDMVENQAIDQLIEEHKEVDDKQILVQNEERQKTEVKQIENIPGRLRNNGHFRQQQQQEGYYKDVRRSFERVYRQETQVEQGRSKKQKKQNLKDMWADCDNSGTQLSLCSRKIQMMLTRRSVASQLNTNTHQSLQVEQIAHQTSIQQAVNQSEKDIILNGHRGEQNAEKNNLKIDLLDNTSSEINATHSTEQKQIILPYVQPSGTTKSCSPWHRNRETASDFDKKCKIKSNLQVKKQTFNSNSNSQDSWGLDPWEMIDTHQENDILLLRNLKKTFEIQGIEESEEDLTKWNINLD